MSRSYKKVPGLVDRNPSAKKEANKRVRRTQDIPNGGAYKKIYQQYIICEYKSLYFCDSDFPDKKPRYKVYMK